MIGVAVVLLDVENGPRNNDDTGSDPDADDDPAQSFGVQLILQRRTNCKVSEIDVSCSITNVYDL